MKKLNLILCNLFFFIILFFTPGFSDSKIEGKPEVIDGDTIKINNIKIRFSGIDAPESYYKGKSQNCKLVLNNEAIFCGKLSKKILKEKIDNKIIFCIPESKDRYKRVIAECFLNNESISSFMVRSGYAFDYFKFSNGKYLKDENFAKKNKLGLWKMEFEYPWEWRKSNK